MIFTYLTAFATLAWSLRIERRLPSEVMQSYSYSA